LFADLYNWYFTGTVRVCIVINDSGGIKMRDKRYGVFNKSRSGKTDGNKSVDDIVSELKKISSPAGNYDYRERSLKIHGLICAKCAREFDYEDRHLLTVHHKDGDHMNNPPDGSNWENLCVYCHEDEHSRGVLGDYFRDEK